MPTKLKPCPFCGGVQIDTLPQPQHDGWLVRCRDCPAQMSVITGMYDQAVASWNQRRPMASNPNTQDLLTGMMLILKYHHAAEISVGHDEIFFGGASAHALMTEEEREIMEKACWRLDRDGNWAIFV